MKIKSLTLLSADLSKVKSFYHDILGFECIEENNTRISFNIGHSILRFQHTNIFRQPTYHFAFNIPENQIEPAQKWLSSKVRLQTDTNNNTIIDFKNWNAHALYFFDAIGNIVEFIARHDLNNSSILPFSADCIINISEIGLPTSEVNALVHTIQANMNIPTYKSGSDKFHPLGDVDGLFICVPTERIWYMTDELFSKDYPCTIEIEGLNQPFEFGDYHFH